MFVGVESWNGLYLTTIPTAKGNVIKHSLGLPAALWALKERKEYVGMQTPEIKWINSDKPQIPAQEKDSFRSSQELKISSQTVYSVEVNQVLHSNGYAKESKNHTHSTHRPPPE